ncbi:hypothetical protein GCM10010530_38170 [Kribbella aluminosa]
MPHPDRPNRPTTPYPLWKPSRRPGTRRHDAQAAGAEHRLLPVLCPQFLFSATTREAALLVVLAVEAGEELFDLGA